MTFPAQFVARITSEKRKENLQLKGEHQKAVARLQKEKSALADHVKKTNHDIAWNEATILRTNSNWRQRKIIEAWERPPQPRRWCTTPQGVFAFDYCRKEKMTLTLEF